MHGRYAADVRESVMVDVQSILHLHFWKRRGEELLHSFVMRENAQSDAKPG